MPRRGKIRKRKASPPQRLFSRKKKNQITETLSMMNEVMAPKFTKRESSGTENSNAQPKDKMPMSTRAMCGVWNLG